VRFAPNDVKGRQVATGNGVSCLWQQKDFHKPGDQTFVAPYSTGNRSTVLGKQRTKDDGKTSALFIRVLLVTLYIVLLLALSGENRPFKFAGQFFHSTCFLVLRLERARGA